MRKETSLDVHRNEEDFYEDLIPKLYKPAKKVIEVIAQELPFVVEPAPEPELAPEPEPATAPEPVVIEHSRPEAEEEAEEPTMLSKWKIWLNNLMKEVTE